VVTFTQFKDLWGNLSGASAGKKSCHPVDKKSGHIAMKVMFSKLA
jgi:hypothetical protein